MTTNVRDLTPAQRKAAAKLWNVVNRIGTNWHSLKVWRNFAQTNTPVAARVAEYAKDGIEFHSGAVLWCRHTCDANYARGYDDVYPSMTPGYLFIAQRAGEPEPN